MVGLPEVVWSKDEDKDKKEEEDDKVRLLLVGVCLSISQIRHLVFHSCVYVYVDFSCNTI
jgi:hypothetical protein